MATHYEWQKQFHAKAMLLGGVYASLSHTIKLGTQFFDADTIKPLPMPEVTLRMHTFHARKVWEKEGRDQ